MVDDGVVPGVHRVSGVHRVPEFLSLKGRRQKAEGRKENGNRKKGNAEGRKSQFFLSKI